jgi:hypothetical protein
MNFRAVAFCRSFFFCTHPRQISSVSTTGWSSADVYMSALMTAAAETAIGRD